MKDLEEYYKKKLEKEQKNHQAMLNEEQAYAKADEMIQKNHQDQIIKLLTDYSDTYKDVGTLLGKSFADAFTEQVKEGMNAYNKLIGNPGVSNNTNIPTDTNTNVGRIEPEYGEEISVGQDTVVFQDPTGTRTKGTVAENGYNSNSKFFRGAYDNGFYAILTEHGGLLGWIPRVQVFKKEQSNIVGFSSGGRTPANIDDGRMAVLHSNEAILNAGDTEKLDKISEAVDTGNILSVALSKLPELITGVFSTAADYLNNLHLLQKDATTRSMTPSSSLDYNGVLGSGTTINNNANTETTSVIWNNEINVTNNTKDDSNFNARSLDKMLRQQASRFR